MRKLLPLLTASLFLTNCGSDDNVAFTPVTPLPSPVIGGRAAPSPILKAPRAVNDRFFAVDNQPLTVSLLANDELNGATIVDPPAGLSAEGQFTDTGSTSRTFTYTLQNAAGTSTGTVVLNRTSATHVNTQAGAGGDGTSQRPYNSLATALLAVGGRPTTFLVTGNQGFGGNYTLSEGQAVVAADAKSPPFFTGTINMANNTQLKDLSFGVSSPNGSVLGTACTGVELVNLQVADNGSLASAIQLTGVQELGVTNLALSNLPRNPVVLTNPVGKSAFNRVSLNNVNGGLVVQASAGQAEVDLNGLRPVNTNGAVTVNVTNTAQLTLNANGYELERGPGQSLLSVDVSGQGQLKASLLDWHENPYKGPDGQAQLINWTTRESGTTFLHVQGWNLETPATGNDRFETFPGFQDRLDFLTQDEGKANLLFTGNLLYHVSGNNFNYPNIITMTSIDNAQVGIRFEQYKNGLTPKALRRDVPFNLVGHGSAQVRANVEDFLQTRQDPSEFQGITPNFNFDGNSKLTALYLFGVSYGSRNVDFLPGYHYEASWLLDNTNLGSLPILNGTQMQVVQDSRGDYVLNTDPANYPNFASVTEGSQLNIPQP